MVFCMIPMTVQDVEHVVFMGIGQSQTGIVLKLKINPVSRCGVVCSIIGFSRTIIKNN